MNDEKNHIVDSIVYFRREYRPEKKLNAFQRLLRWAHANPNLVATTVAFLFGAGMTAAAIASVCANY